MIPGLYLHQEVTYQPYIGHTGAGPRWGAPVVLRARFDPVRRKITNASGIVTTSEGKLVLRPGYPERIDPQDRFTISGRLYSVAETKPVNGVGSRIHHVEVLLK